MTTKTEPRQNFATFLLNHRVTMSLQPTDHNPYMRSSDAWDATAHHYRVTLRHQGRRMQLYFSTGSGWQRDPNVEDVLECIALDASGMISNDFQYWEWCREYGYDGNEEDLRKMFSVTKRQTESLTRLLGGEVLDELLYRTAF
jgi:hypothetical protein